MSTLEVYCFDKIKLFTSCWFVFSQRISGPFRSRGNVPLRFRRRRHSIDFLAILYLQLGAVSHILSTKGPLTRHAFLAHLFSSVRCRDVVRKMVPMSRSCDSTYNFLQCKTSAVECHPKPVVLSDLPLALFVRQHSGVAALVRTGRPWTQ